MTIKMERVLSSELKPASKNARSFIESSRIAQVFLKTLGVFGVSLVMSGMVYTFHCPNCADIYTDGVLTPAQSVLGAIQG